MKMENNTEKSEVSESESTGTMAQISESGYEASRSSVSSPLSSAADGGEGPTQPTLEFNLETAIADIDCATTLISMHQEPIMSSTQDTTPILLGQNTNITSGSTTTRGDRANVESMAQQKTATLTPSAQKTTWQKPKIRMTFPQQAVGIAPPLLQHNFVPTLSTSSSVPSGRSSSNSTVRFPQLQTASGPRPFVLTQNAPFPVFMMVRPPSNSEVQNMPSADMTMAPGVNFVRPSFIPVPMRLSSDSQQQQQQQGTSMPMQFISNEVSGSQSQPCPILFRVDNESLLRQPFQPSPSMAFQNANENPAPQGPPVFYRLMRFPIPSASTMPQSQNQNQPIMFLANASAPSYASSSSGHSIPVPLEQNFSSASSTGPQQQQAQLKLTTKVRDDSEGYWMDVIHTKKLSHTVECCYSTNEKLSLRMPDLPVDGDSEFISKRLNIMPGTTYKFRVAAINSCGRGPWSEPAAFRTDDPGLPSAPTRIQITKKPDGSANITWEPPAHMPGSLLEYTVFMNVKQGGPLDPRFGSAPFSTVYRGPKNTCIVPQEMMQRAKLDVKDKPAYIFRIAAKNEKGYGAATQIRWLQ